MEESYRISKKQSQLLELALDPTITELLVGGAAGGGKSMSVCMAVALVAMQFPGTRFFIGRKTLKSLKQSTINTLLTKVHPLLGITEADFHFSAQGMELQYANGSLIIFGELDYFPSDPDYARLGSLEIDIAVIEEAGEITLQAKNAIKSRVGRGELSSKYNIPGKVWSSCNPSMNYLRQEYYDPYDKLGGGGFQKWQIGTTDVNGVETPAYRAFLQMNAWDNPFLPKSYIDNLETLPDRERKRLLEGNWDYADEDSSLFRSGLLDKALCYELPPRLDERFDKFIGVDLADKGGDKTIFTLIENGVVVQQRASQVQMTWDEKSEQPMSRLVADELVDFAQRNGFTPQFSRHIAVETNGVGVGCLPAGEKITTTIGIFPIESVKKTDTLYGKDGDEIAITQLLDYQYDGPLFELVPYGFARGEKFTSEHPIWASISIPSKDGRKHAIKHDFKWFRAEKMKSGLWIREKNVYQQEKAIPDMSRYDFCEKPNRYANKSKQQSMNKILLKPETWWVIGYWLGDGWLQNLTGKGEIHFCYNPAQLEFREKVETWATTIHRKATRYTKPAVENNVIRCKAFARFLDDNFGQKAHGKHLPEWVKFLPKKYKLSLLQGYFDSDGNNLNYTSKGQRVYSISWASCNNTLLEDIKAILDGLELPSSITATTRRSGFKPGSIKYSLRLGWAASVRLNKMFEQDCKLVKPDGVPVLSNRRQYCYFEDGWIYRQIKEVKKTHYIGTVYNFSTADETFMAGRIPTHNCRDMLKERGWQLTEYTATHKSRSEGYYQMMLDMDTGDLKIWYQLSGLDELRKQLMAHTYEMNNQVPSVVKKEKIKQAVGHSPDEADSLMIANWVRFQHKHPELDPRRNSNRIRF